MPSNININKVDELTENFKQTSSIYFTKYTGMSVLQATEFRAECNKHSVRYIVSKNTLTKIAANNAEFVWCQLPESVEVCGQINPNSAQLKYGYLDSMKNIRRLPSKEQDIDLLMAGMPSPRRKQIMKALNEEGHKTTYPGQPLPVYIRDALLARSRLSLSLQKTDKHQIVSVTRICHSVINRVPLLLEISNREDEYARFCFNTVATHLVPDVGRYLTETDLETWSEQRYQELADELPMDRFMADLLNETVYQRL